MTKRSRAKVSRAHILAVRVVFDKPVTIREARTAAQNAMSAYGFDGYNIDVARDDDVVFGRVAGVFHTGKVGK